MTAAHVSRRFDVHAPDPDVLLDVESTLYAAVRGTPGVTAPEPPHRVERPPLLEVRLRGPAAAVSTVVAAVATIRGTSIRNDVVTAPGVAPGAIVYPDPRARLRMSESGHRDRPRLAAPVTVAIVDSGITVDHPDLADHLWTAADGTHGRRFKDGSSDGDITDQDGHGTMLAGMILSAADRSASVRLMTAKFFDAATPPQPDNAAAAIHFAVAEHAQVILLSWDVGIGSLKLERAVREACRSALVVLAAGNGGRNNDDPFPPVPVRYVIEEPERSTAMTVMATDETDEKAWFSNYGMKSVDLAAPGVDIVSTRRLLSRAAEGPQYRSFSGTSSSAAHVAGAAALLMSLYPELSARATKERLVASVYPRPGLRCVSRGRLDIDAALRGA